MENNNVTNEELARMVQKGFEETAKKIDMDQRFDVIEKDIKEIKEILIRNNTKRIEKLEERMDKLNEALALK